MIFGLFIYLFCYSVTFLFPHEIRKSFLIVLTIHGLIIIIYSYFEFNYIGATEDAASFYNHAIDRSLDINKLNWGLSALSNGHDLFKNIHALLQHLFSGPQKIISYSTTLLGWSLCMLTLSKLYLHILKDDYFGANMMNYFFALTPSILIFNSYFLREVWLSLFILLIVYSAVIQKDLLKKILLIILISILGLFFHRFMILMLASIIAIIFIYDAILDYKWYPFNNVKLFAYALILLCSSFFILILDFEALHYLKEYGLFGAIDQYTISLVAGHGDGAPAARATYGKIFDKDRIFSIFEVFLAYQFMPYPWKISSILDLAPLFENFLRFTYIVIFINYRKHLNLYQKMILDMIFLIWLSIEFIWSLGTINWGTAYRHHTVVYGLLLLVALVSYRNSRINDSFDT